MVSDMVRVLIVCEENELAIAVKHVLRGEGQGNNIEVASSFCDAEPMIVRQTFDLVIIDGDMKERCRTMQKASARVKRLQPRTKIVFMTSDSDSEASREADAVLSKPFTSLDLIREVSHAIAKI